MRNSDVAALLSKFKDHLTCWKVGLSIGSFLYFEMGKKLPAKLEDGSTVEIGSTTLVLECDEWTITWKGKQIANSDSVDPDLVKGLVWKYFSNKPLNRIHFSDKLKKCTIFFGEQGVIAGEVVIQLQGEADEDMCTITFPDGTIIFCNAKDGFASDGSRSEVHVAAYASD
jgi:hypothetical protein